MNREEKIMTSMKGRKDLGVHRIPPTQAIPKQSKAPTKTSNSDNKKMKKVMKKAGMLDNC